MILLLPIAFLLFFFLIKTKEGTDFFETLARSLLLWQLVLLIITNLLSVVNGVTRLTTALFWALLCLALVTALYKCTVAGQRETSPLFPSSKGKKDISEKIMISIMAVLFLLLFGAALFTVPYNYDSMTYHLARIGHWIDNQSVNHFITNIDRQNYSPVLAEYNLLHMFLLTGSDSFLNMLQYTAMLITALYIYKCAKMLGTDRSFSLFGAFLFVTMPLTISQSMTTQNDLFGAMWFSLFLYYLLQFIDMDALHLNKETFQLLFFTSLTVHLPF